MSYRVTFTKHATLELGMPCPACRTEVQRIDMDSGGLIQVGPCGCFLRLEGECCIKSPKPQVAIGDTVVADVRIAGYTGRVVQVVGRVEELLEHCRSANISSRYGYFRVDWNDITGKLVTSAYGCDTFTKVQIQ